MLLQLSKTVKQSPKSPQIFENNGTFCADRPFSKNRSETNCQKSFVFNQLVSEASIVHPFNNNWNIILPTPRNSRSIGFNRTSFQQQLKRLEKRAKSAADRGFNRTSFQQQLKPRYVGKAEELDTASIVHPFNNNWNMRSFSRLRQRQMLQSYILSTTTETYSSTRPSRFSWCFNRTSFQQQLKLLYPVTRLASLLLQSYILSTTTETSRSLCVVTRFTKLQSYILSTTTETICLFAVSYLRDCFNRTSFQQQLKHPKAPLVSPRTKLQSYILSTTTETEHLRTSPPASLASIVHPFNNNWNVTRLASLFCVLASIVHPFNNNWNRHANS